MSALSVTPLPTVTPLRTKKLRNILFATDFSEASIHALPYVAGIARQLGSSVYLCHIVEPNPLVFSAPEVAPGLYERMHHKATAQLADLAHSPEFKQIDTKTVVSEGAIGHTLPNIVVEKEIDLIVMGTH